MKKYLEAGRVERVHGVAGDVTVSCLCDTTAVFAGLKRIFTEADGDSYKEYAVTRNVRLNGDAMLVHLDGIDSREDAMRIKGKYLFADRDDLPPLQDGTYFIADLIGLPVIDAGDGTVYGKLADVYNYGASDVYEICSDDGKKVLFPAVGEFIEKTDLEKGIYVKPIKGMFS